MGESTPAQPAETAPAGPSWDRARALLDGVKTAVRLSIAGQVMLGLELKELKAALGLTGSGRRKEKPQVADFVPWPEIVKAELGISKDTADRLIEMWEAARLKVKKLGHASLLEIMDTPPAALDAVRRAKLAEAVAGVTWGETQKSLLEELRLVKVRLTPTYEDQQAGGRAERKIVPEEQLAWDFAGGDVVTELHKIRTGTHYAAALHTMPLRATETVPFGLADYVAELKETYETAAAVLAMRTA